MRRSVILVVSMVLVLIVTGFVINNVATKIWSSWVNYVPPVDIRTRLQSDYNYPKIADYVVIILVDGARPDVVNDIGYGGFIFVKHNGVLFSNAYALLPTYSVPARAAISTGLPHEISGVSSNWYSKGVLNVPNMFSLAKRFSLKTAAVGDNSIKMLFGNYLDTFVQIPEIPGQMYNATKEAIKIINDAQPPNLLWIGFSDIDEVGHEYGALSDQYKEAVKGSSKAIMDIINALSMRGILERTLLIILSDHGHLNTGGHGGGEIEVRRIYLSMMGPGVKKSIIINRTVYYTSIASTVTFALGLPPELVSYELPLFDGFDESIRKDLNTYMIDLTINFAYHLEDLFEKVKLNNYVQNVTRIIDELKKLRSTSSDNVMLILDYHNKLASIYENGKSDLLSRDFVFRIGGSFLIGLIAWLPTIIVLYLSKRMFWKIIITGLIGVAVFWTSFIYVFKFLPTMSSVNSLDFYITSIMWSTLLSIIMSSLVMIIVFNVKYKKHAILFLSPLFVIMTISSIPILIMSSIYGFTVKFPFPDWSVAYLYYTALLNEMFLALFSGLMPIIIFTGLTFKSKITKQI
ncbi:MAG: alkaline phosphatase family protein [Thermoprotei archaeon]